MPLTDIVKKNGLKISSARFFILFYSIVVIPLQNHIPLCHSISRNISVFNIKYSVFVHHERQGVEL